MKTQVLALLVTAFAANAAHAAPKCIFGGDLSELSASKRFKIQDDVLKTFKLSRIHSANPLIMVSVSVVTDKKTKRQYHLNTTFRHRDDGDNTIGWIEDVTGAATDDGAPNEGQVVAVIGDSSIDTCSITE